MVVSSLTLTGLILGNLVAGEPALIKIDLDRTIYTRCEKYSSTVSKDIPYLDLTAVLTRPTVRGW
jgi:hypothetical protein